MAVSDIISRANGAPSGEGLSLRLRDVERAAIERTLLLTKNNRSAAARILGISRPSLLRKLKSYRIELLYGSR
jgi:sigma-54 dependent transcriptional regulator, acetoin dehydrogenase operon transcriptional activator AcoR